MNAEVTQAKKWVQSLKDRTAGISGVDPMGAAVKVAMQLDIEYPNQVFLLTQQDQVIGSRRVFGDRSYCQLLDKDAAIGMITFGVMSDGMLGTAQNGRLIMGTG